MTSFNIFRARWQLGLLAPEDVPNAATDLLAADVETPALIELAGLEAPTWWEVRPLIERAIEEAALPQVSDDAARWLVAYDVAERILDGSVPPRDGADRLGSLCRDLDMPESLRYFVYLSVDYGVGPSGAAWFDQAIIESARQLLALRPQANSS
jgi:hypothetical protein